MAEQRTVNERHDVYNKITRRNEESKRSNEKQEETKKKKKLDDARTTISAGSMVENSESEFEKREKAELRAKSEASVQEAGATPAKIATQTPRRNRWDYAPSMTETYTKGAGGETPTPGRWVEPTPMRGGDTLTPRRMSGRSRFDELPSAGTASGGETPLYGTQRDPNLMTPTPEISGAKMQMWRLEKELSEKSRIITDEELDKLLPSQGYEVSFLFQFYMFHFEQILHW